MPPNNQQYQESSRVAWLWGQMGKLFASLSCEQKGHDSRAIANIFIEKAAAENRKLTIMQLVKLVYFAHGWTLGYTGAPLIREKVEVWRYGPMIPLVYNTFRAQGLVIRSRALDEKRRPYFAEVSDVEDKIISNVYREYSQLSAYQLSDDTHGPDAQWAYGNSMPPYHDVNNKTIMQYFQKRAAQARENHV